VSLLRPLTVGLTRWVLREEGGGKLDELARFLAWVLCCEVLWPLVNRSSRKQAERRMGMS
jgi:hypothetical protein